MSVRDLSALLLLSALWGGSFLLMRVAAPVLGPVLLIELRVLLAGLALLAFALLTRRVPTFRAQWRHFLAIGALNSALPFLLIASATVHLPASLAATPSASHLPFQRFRRAQKRFHSRCEALFSPLAPLG
ncbi:EamA family transporter [Deinococcus arcticus]|uniref:EamA domain-containing protein n=1 Tax=Deinococcus arcticus TaxID=2136176 RepID=A0A2T3WAL5_9DEIO|nr:EamA family transporter [Deinococcus arcticus]PTA68958.1 hypothetical protein C8263_03920 [Deinococcus arcticus]